MDPYAREHSDPHVGGLPPLSLDRQRIVHSSAFRRLQYKTQVFVALEADHYRTRLTHTLEVAHLARLIAVRLGLDAELAEVVGLAHDLGHPPFGHAGERALDECLREHGGFEHNDHALRVVEYLEHPYPEFRGLNLTRVVRACLARHSTRYDRPKAHQAGDPEAPMEGLVLALADRLAYCLHDLQDALYAELVRPGDAARLGLLAGDAREALSGSGVEWRGRLRPAIDRIQAALIRDVRETSDVGGRLVRLSQEMEWRVSELESFLAERVYRHQALVRMDAKAQRIVREVFGEYVNEPRLMPPRYAERVGEQAAQRVAVDYIAGMTDRFCLREHARLFDPRMDA
jgi:dGTPase